MNCKQVMACATKPKGPLRETLRRMFHFILRQGVLNQFKKEAFSEGSLDRGPCGAHTAGWQCRMSSKINCNQVMVCATKPQGPLRETLRRTFSFSEGCTQAISKRRVSAGSLDRGPCGAHTAGWQFQISSKMNCNQVMVCATKPQGPLRETLRRTFSFSEGCTQAISKRRVSAGSLDRGPSGAYTGILQMQKHPGINRNNTLIRNG